MGKTVGAQGLCPEGCGQRLSHGRYGNPHKTFAKHGCPTGGQRVHQNRKARKLGRIPTVHDDCPVHYMRTDLVSFGSG